MASTNRIFVPERLPFLTLSDGVLFPGVTVRIPCRAPQNIAVIEQRLLNGATLENSLIGLAFQLPNTAESSEEFCEIGVAAIVTQVVGTNWPRPSYILQLTAVCRVKIGTILRKKPYMFVSVTQVDKFPGKTVQEDKTNKSVKPFLDDLDVLINALPQSAALAQLKRVLSTASMDFTADLAASVVEATYTEKISVLRATDFKNRLKIVHSLVKRQLEQSKRIEDEKNGNFVAEVIPEPVKIDDIAKALVRNFINQNTTTRMNGNGGARPSEDDKLENKLRNAKMPPETERIALEELRKMKMASSHEHPSIRQYLELLAELPWSIETKDSLDLANARKILDEEHYGLETVKKRILEYLAVKQMKNSLKGPILCFVGPPGVGKTSIARSIANTLGRKFHRISLGGVADQSDIRGFHRTYVGSMPGRIINGLKIVKSKNPVFLLDEVDKLFAGIRGDPAAALLEVLDPEQNYQFVDHYMNVPFDLSNVLFIATANRLDSIPDALLDRMEVISLSGYTVDEKVSIAHKFLIPKQLKEHGLTEDHVRVPEDTIRTTIQRYTREAGVRGLERKLGAIMRSAALKVAEHSHFDAKSADSMSMGRVQLNDFPLMMDEQALEDILGQALYVGESVEQLLTPGVAAGLAWTPFGGEIMYVEATKMDGEGKMTLTGQLGDVMKESASVALNWLRSHAAQLGISMANGADLLEKTDIHIHFPAGSVNKDGPSAGVTVLVALASLFTSRCVRSDTAMTGEITLRGLVLRVGGIKEKLLAARRAGFTRVIVPKRNIADLAELPKDLQAFLQIETVDRIEDLLSAAFEGGFPRLVDSAAKSKL